MRNYIKQNWDKGCSIIAIIIGIIIVSTISYEWGNLTHPVSLATSLNCKEKEVCDIKVFVSPSD